MSSLPEDLKISEDSMPIVPIIGEPFQRIAMDIMGPLPKTRRGHRYLLVIVDYATQYPEAVPLKSFTADVVAEKLIARYGIPNTILMDQGSNFTSTLLKELYRLLHGSQGPKDITVPPTN